MYHLRVRNTPDRMDNPDPEVIIYEILYSVVIHNEKSNMSDINMAFMNLMSEVNVIRKSFVKLSGKVVQFLEKIRLLFKEWVTCLLQ